MHGVQWQAMTRAAMVIRFYSMSIFAFLQSIARLYYFKR